ncbi:MAG: PSD1 and planctomycete cytochrome C domain-containing protein [Verrucomicrobiota bacterium]
MKCESQQERRGFGYSFAGATVFMGLCIGAVAQEKAVSLVEEDYTQEEIAFFENKIRPILAEHCYECHSESADKVKGGLLLDTRAGSRRGGVTDHAVVPGSITESLLITAIAYEDEEYEMPPKYQLDAAVVADFREWIEMGAPDPRGGEAADVVSNLDIDAGREFWAYRSPVRPEVPEVTDEDGWVTSDIDRFVLAELHERGLEPAEGAKRLVLLRRIYFDLVGIPPSIEDLRDFVQDESAGAVERVVDRLLQSEQFGERWGRHWLDVARYAESSGKEANNTFPYAWRYRDYVIDAFNEDKPYNDFIREQIAGDLLPYEDEGEQARLMTATGFLAIGPKSLNETNPVQFKADLIDEQIDTMTQAVLATTVACARCHDHMFDPIPMTDYYAMAGIFLSTDTYFGGAAGLQNRQATDLLWVPGAEVKVVPGTQLSRETVLGLERQLAQLQREQRDLQEMAAQARRSGEALDPSDQQRFLRLRGAVGALEARLKAVDDSGNPHPYAMGVWEAQYPRDAALLVRGEIAQPGETVPRGFVQVLMEPGGEPEIPRGSSGRLEMADWLSAEENPLTARVMVNRVWHYLFGRGLVPTVDNFGSTGQAPSHPDLLDWLAVEFMENGWSVKSLVREIVLSGVYQQASDHHAANFEIDPDNVYLWRASKRRLDAEAIRDAMLAVSGNLESERPIGSPVARVGDGLVGGRQVTEESLELGAGYRSVYLPIVRDLVPDALETFDFAEPSLVTGSRDVTTVPGQALYLMNSDFVQEQAVALAHRLVHEGGSDGVERLRTAFLTVYSRPPTEEEGRRAKKYFDRFMAEARMEDASVEEAGKMAMASFCQALLGSAEFRYLD